MPRRLGADREVLDDNRAWLNIELADLPAAVEHAVDLPAVPSAWPNLTLMRNARCSRRP